MSRGLVVGARVWDGCVHDDADAVGWEDGRIVAVGRADALRARLPGAREWDAGGATVTPGLCDAHLHLAPWARARAQCDLHAARTRAAALATVAAALAADPGPAPLVGRGWDETGWEAAPLRDALDALAPERPVLLHRHDFHALWVNSAALRAAGVGRATRDPAGGRFERDAAGEPTGVVREHAVAAFAMLEEAAGPAVDAALADAVAAALHARGITMVHDFQREPREARWTRDLAARRRLRVLQHFGPGQMEGLIAAGVGSAVGDAWFRLGALKLFADGTLGSRTAAMLAPYEDDPGTGMDLLAPADLAALVARAFLAGLSVTVHAIGDRAVRHTLDAIATAPQAARRDLPLPPRIEHAQLVAAGDFARFAALGVVASMQPQHCVTDIAAATLAWGRRCTQAYAWRSFARLGVPLAFGSDAPVEPPSPWLGLHAAVTRERPDGTPAGGFEPHERLTLDEALHAYTAVPAACAGLSGVVGTLAPGAVADLVTWDRDLHASGPGQLHAARPVRTVLAGEIVYDYTASPAAVAAGALGNPSRV